MVSALSSAAAPYKERQSANIEYQHYRQQTICRKVMRYEKWQSHYFKRRNFREVKHSRNFRDKLSQMTSNDAIRENLILANDYFQ